MTDHRDLVIETFADIELELRERIADLERLLVEALADSQSYRVLAQQAIHALARLTEQHRQQRDRYHRMLDDYRELRALLETREAA